MSRAIKTGGHIRHRGKGYEITLDLGGQPARRCSECDHRHWIEGFASSVTKCEACGAALRDVVQERRQYAKGGFVTEKAARAELTKLTRQRDEGLSDPIPETITVRDFFDRWLAHKASQGRAAKTIDRYRSLLESDALPIIGSMKLNAVRPGHIQHVLDAAQNRGLAPRTVVQLRAILSGGFRTGIAWGKLVFNPVASITPPKLDTTAKMDVPDASAVLRLIEAARETVWYVAIVLASTCGLRRSEVLGLAWDMIEDGDDGRVVLRCIRGLQRIPAPAGEPKPLVLLPTKSHRSSRQFTIPAFTAAVLRQHRKDQTERQLEFAGAWRTDFGHLVCDRGDGGPLDPDAFTKAAKRLMASVGIPAHTRLHDLRHQFATTLLEQGVDAAIVAQMLGHANPAFTQHVYQHVRTKLTERGADAMDAALGGHK